MRSFKRFALGCGALRMARAMRRLQIEVVNLECDWRGVNRYY